MNSSVDYCPMGDTSGSPNDYRCFPPLPSIAEKTTIATLGANPYFLTLSGVLLSATGKIDQKTLSKILPSVSYDLTKLGVFYKTDPLLQNDIYPYLNAVYVYLVNTGANRTDEAKRALAEIKKYQSKFSNTYLAFVEISATGTTDESWKSKNAKYSAALKKIEGKVRSKYSRLLRAEKITQDDYAI